ncbi:aminopeptidase Q [Suncus etruscus]|uniref:aminopeptidase Q n=1 Tax=Suncus etruscus TaxID=109475 RepID=UPI00210F2B2B|nr:aminopeptidase Q [Suncus etruscus]
MERHAVVSSDGWGLKLADRGAQTHSGTQVAPARGRRRRFSAGGWASRWPPSPPRASILGGRVWVATRRHGRPESTGLGSPSEGGPRTTAGGAWGPAFRVRSGCGSWKRGAEDPCPGGAWGLPSGRPWAAPGRGEGGALEPLSRGRCRRGRPSGQSLRGRVRPARPWDVEPRPCPSSGAGPASLRSPPGPRDATQPASLASGPGGVRGRSLGRAGADSRPSAPRARCPALPCPSVRAAASLCRAPRRARLFPGRGAVGGRRPHIRAGVRGEPERADARCRRLCPRPLPAAMGSARRPGPRPRLSRPAGLLLAGLAATLLALALLAALRAPDPGGTPARAPPGRPRPGASPRLPPGLAPLHYDLQLWPRLRPGAPSPRFSGRVAVTLRCARPAARLLLHSRGLACGAAEVRGPLARGAAGAQGPAVPVRAARQAPGAPYLVLELGRALRPGRLYRVRLGFGGAASLRAREGLFLDRYADRGEPRTLLASQMEPTFARNVFPCFDEPALKATFNITIIHHPHYTSLSNMPKLNQFEKDVNGSKWTVTTFDTTPPMPTYLVAFALCDFDYINRTERGKEIRIWARKDAIAQGNADFALNITGSVFSFLEDLFNISYILPKTDIIALPDFDNQAMENWGLMVFDESALLLLPSDQLTTKKTVVSYITSHEIAHQWFGNLVTMKWWNNIWLNEGFATYFEFAIISYLNPKLTESEVFFSTVLLNIFEQDHAEEARTVSLIVENFTETSEINELFDYFTYYKGACMVRMLSGFLNETLFINALKSYLRTFSYSNAEQDDLWRYFQVAIDNQSKTVLPATVKDIMDSWTYQSGFPVLTLHVSTGVMKQEPFYRENTPSTHNKTWIVPVLWMKNGIAQSLVWLDQSIKIFPEMQISESNHDWVILNLNTTGYYRVKYDELGWKKINEQLEKDPKAIPVIHRLQLIEDAFFLSKNNYIEIETALELTKYLAEEDEILVWHSVLENLVTNDLVSEVNNYDLYPLLKKYLLKRLTLIWSKYSTTIRENVSILKDDYFALLYLEKLFLTVCWLGVEDCLQISRELFRKWMAHPEDAIPEPIKNVILCYGIALGNDKEWDFLLNVYKNETEEEEKMQYAYAMGCSRDPRTLKRYLQYAITTSSFDLNETNVMEAVAVSEVGRYIVKDFLVDHWQVVSERYGSQLLVNLMSVLGQTLTTESQITELHRFFSHMLEEHQRLAAQAKLQAIKNENLKHRKRHARIAAWLRKHT